MSLIVIITILGIAAAEAVSYFGLIKNHLGYSANIFFFIGFIAATISRLPLKKRHKLWILILNLVLTTLYLVLNAVENITFPNYIYSNFHINLPGLKVFNLLLVLYSVLILQAAQKYLKKISIALLIAYTSLTISDEFGRSIAFLIKQTRVWINNPSATYEQKMIKSYGGFYPAMMLVRQLTPEKSIILIPPQANPWEVEGNAPMVSYFLYPRQVINFDNYQFQHELPEYALIAHGSWAKTGNYDYGWPKIKINANKIWNFDINNLTTTEFEQDYLPDLAKWEWGLIEVSDD